MQCTYSVTLSCVRVTVVVVEKAISITYSECVSVFSVIQHAKHMRLVILSSVECLGLSNFSKLSHELHDLRKRDVEHAEDSKQCNRHTSTRT